MAETTALLSVDDLTDDEVRSIFKRATEYADRGPLPRHADGPLVGLIFLAPSMRTRVGFSTAASRLGGSAVDVTELRFGMDMSAAESFTDTLRTVSGMVDVIVARTEIDLDRASIERACVTPFVSAGHGKTEHPSQALIDLYAIQRLKGDVDQLTIAICGDLRMRAVTSLLKLLSRNTPRSIVLVAPEQRRGSPPIDGMQDIARFGDMSEVFDADVVYMAGLPAGQGNDHLDDRVRAGFALSGETMDQIRNDAIVLCPLPCIDEIDETAKHDSRVRMFEQSDLGVYVRMALLRHLQDTDH